ncbi:MAG: Cro/CI family transcriptional regulator [Ilumatobacteraceae bacterium]
MTDQQDNAVKALIESMGGTTQAAAMCGVTEGAVRHWVRKGRVPKTAALLIERLNPAWEAVILSADVKAEE